MTPEARKETAIGMKTTSLNAVAQRMRSVSTAKISPATVTTMGATTTHTTLLRSATNVGGLVNIRM